MSLTTCSVCHKNCERIHFATSPSGVKRYQDDKGRKWKGKKCPDCLRIEHTLYMQELRGTDLKEINCAECGITFMQKIKHQKYCSRKCRIKYPAMD
jgi:hypothetical protein